MSETVDSATTTWWWELKARVSDSAKLAGDPILGSFHFERTVDLSTLDAVQLETTAEVVVGVKLFGPDGSRCMWNPYAPRAQGGFVKLTLGEACTPAVAFQIRPDVPGPHALHFQVWDASNGTMGLLLELKWEFEVGPPEV